MNEIECIHGIYPETSCTICTKKDLKDKAEGFKIDFPFRAKSDYNCFKCDDPIEKWQLVYRLKNGMIVCKKCTDVSNLEIVLE